MRTFRYEGGATRQFHLDGQHDQQAHAGGGAKKGKPPGGGEYIDGLWAPDLPQQALKPKKGTLFNKSTRLQGRNLEVMDPIDVDYQGLQADGHIVATTGARKSRVYLKPTGQMVKGNRTRGPLVEFEEIEIDTAVDGRTIIGRPGAPTGNRQYALAEMFPEIPAHMRR